MKKVQKLIKNRSGQALVEFTVMAAMFAFIIVALFALFGVFSEYGWRLLYLVGHEFP